MNDQLPDKTVLLIILATLLLVFFLVFSFKSKKIELEKLTDCAPSEKQSGTDLEKAYTNVINTELAARLAGLKK